MLVRAHGRCGRKFRSSGKDGRDLDDLEVERLGKSEAAGWVSAGPVACAFGRPLLFNFRAKKIGLAYYSVAGGYALPPLAGANDRMSAGDSILVSLVPTRRSIWMTAYAGKFGDFDI